MKSKENMTRKIKQKVANVNQYTQKQEKDTAPICLKASLNKWVFSCFFTGRKMNAIHSTTLEPPLYKIYLLLSQNMCGTTKILFPEHLRLRGGVEL